MNRGILAVINCAVVFFHSSYSMLYVVTVFFSLVILFHKWSLSFLSCYDVL